MSELKTNNSQSDQENHEMGQGAEVCSIINTSMKKVL